MKSRTEQVLEGLKILNKYEDNIAAEHDVIYAGPETDDVSAEDCKALEALGWFIDESAGSWARYV